MLRTELVASVAKKAGISIKDADAAIKVFTEIVTLELRRGREVYLHGFGTFGVREWAARRGRNPQTGEEIMIPSNKIPQFKVDRAFRDAINKL